MTGNCPCCRKSYSVPSHRGSKVSNHRCPDCDVPLQGHGAGQKREKHRDLVYGGIFVYKPDDPTWVRLEQPMVLAPWEPEPGGWRKEPSDWYDQPIIDRCAGKVFGPGCVVMRSLLDRDLTPRGRWPYLIPIPEGAYDSATLVESSGPIKQVKCKACGDMVTEPAPRPQEPWKPIREGRYRRRQWQVIPQGPHAAGTPACPRCYPAAWPKRVQDSVREDDAAW